MGDGDKQTKQTCRESCGKLKKNIPFFSGSGKVNEPHCATTTVL